MKLSFLRDGSPDCPLLMLSDLSAQDLSILRDAAADLASGKRGAADLRFDPSSELGLTLCTADRDRGILMTPPRFECLLRKSTWSNIEGLIEPFSQGGSGFQWLDDSGEVALLLSPLGVW